MGRSLISPRYSCGLVICRPPLPPVRPLNCSTISGKRVATASVTRARYSPLIRSAGSPISTPATKQTTAESTVAPSSGMSSAGDQDAGGVRPDPVQGAVADRDLAVVTGEQVQAARADRQRHPAAELLDAERLELEGRVDQQGEDDGPGDELPGADASRRRDRRRGERRRVQCELDGLRIGLDRVGCDRIGCDRSARWDRARGFPGRRSYPLHLLLAEESLRPEEQHGEDEHERRGERHLLEHGDVARAGPRTGRPRRTRRRPRRRASRSRRA